MRELNQARVMKQQKATLTSLDFTPVYSECLLSSRHCTEGAKSLKENQA